MRSLRDETLRKVLSHMDLESFEALEKGLKAFLDLAKTNNQKNLKKLKTLLEEGIINEKEFKEFKKRINNGLLDEEEAKAIAWLKSQAMVIYKTLKEIKANQKISKVS